MSSTSNQFRPGQSGNPQGRKPGQHSAISTMRRANDKALRVVAEAAEDGDLTAAIAVLEHNRMGK